MFPTKTLLTIVTLVTLPVSAAAQFTIGPQINPGLTFTRILPSVESRSGFHDQSMGDSIVGGSVHAFAGMVRQQQGSYEMADLAIELSATGTFLGRTAEIVDISGYGDNVLSNGVQTRSGQFRYEVQGVTMLGTFQAGISAFDTGLFNLFPTAVTGSVSVLGGYRANLTGNFSCGFGLDADWQLPAAKADVSAVVNGDCFAIFSASGTITMGSKSGVVTMIGRVVNNQVLAVNATTSAGSGLSGSANYTMGRASASMSAFSVTNQTSLWSAAAVSKKLM